LISKTCQLVAKKIHATHDWKDGKENKEGGELWNFLLGTMLPTKIKLKNILGLSGR
jgi:hypothetical protein